MNVNVAKEAAPMTTAAQMLTAGSVSIADTKLDHQTVGRLYREDLERQSTIDTLTAHVEALRAEKREELQKRNRALLPRGDDPAKALNYGAAKAHEKRIQEIDEEIERYEGAIDEARKVEFDQRRAEREHDHAEKLTKLSAALDRREKAAVAMDKAAKAFASTFAELHAATAALPPLMVKYDTSHPSTSGASLTKTENAVRERLRDLGVSWAAPHRLAYVASPPTIADTVRALNDMVFRAQPEKIED